MPRSLLSGIFKLILRDYVNEILYSGQRDGLIRIWEQKSVGLLLIIRNLNTRF